MFNLLEFLGFSPVAAPAVAPRTQLSVTPASLGWGWSAPAAGFTPQPDTAALAGARVINTAAAPAPAPAYVPPTALATGPMPTRRLVATGSARTSAIPVASGARASVQVARGMTSYRQVALPVSRAARTIAIPAAPAGAVAKVEVFALQPHRSGKHVTQVLVPVSGTRVTVPAGAQVRFLVRVTGVAAGSAAIDAGVTTVAATVTRARVRPLARMTWVNHLNAAAKGVSVGQIEQTLARFGVASSSAPGGTARFPRHYLSAASEAAHRAPIGPVADMIVAKERELAHSAPSATLWVQVSDEQDATMAAGAVTAQWIARLDAELQRRGSRVKLFAACQPRAQNLGYAAHLDGWAVTQSSAGHTRAASIAAVQKVAARAGRTIELMEYPGNAFFDAGTPSGAAVSTASAALDGARAWFLYSANNLATLESGRGVEGRGDIGGLIAVQRGTVLPTLALAEADYGANLGSAARALAGVARSGAAARAVSGAARTLDANQRAGRVDFAAWEHAIGAQLHALG